MATIHPLPIRLRRQRPPFDIPAPPTYPPRWAIRRRPVDMTIVAGFRCRDGIVLCSDSELTLGDLFKTPHGAKIAYSKDREYSLIIAGAGNIDFVQALWEQILSDIDASDKKFESIKSLIAGNFARFYRRHIYIAPKEMTDYLNIRLLIGLWTQDGKIDFMKSSDSALLSAENFEVIGTGMPLGNYLIERMAGTRISVAEAEALAAYIVKQAKKFVPYCGGETRIWFLRPDGAVQESGLGRIAKIEEFFEQSDRMTGPAFVNMASGGFSEEKFEQWLRDFGNKMKELSKQMRDMAIPPS